MNPATAYVLVQTDRTTDRIARLLRGIPGVMTAQDVRGPYDALAMARADGADDTLELIVDRIRALPGVIRALAAPVALPTAKVPSTDAA